MRFRLKRLTVPMATPLRKEHVIANFFFLFFFPFLPFNVKQADTRHHPLLRL